MEKIEYNPIVSVVLKDYTKAGTKKTAREIADLLCFGVVKGYVKKPGQELKTHYFNCMLDKGKPTDYYLIVAPNASAEYYVDDTKFAHYVEETA